MTTLRVHQSKSVWLRSFGTLGSVVGYGLGLAALACASDDNLGLDPRFAKGLWRWTRPSFTTPAVQAWLAAHPQVHFHFTPKGALWLNMVEAWFSVLTRKSVRRGSFDTVRALVRHIGRYIEE